jgi:hypothetical protein
MRAISVGLLYFVLGFSCSYAQSFPEPAVGSGCNDDPWKAKGHWSSLQDSQYGAELLDKGDRGYKLKIVKRERDTIKPHFCSYFGEQLTTEQLNTWYSDGNAMFIQIPVKDASLHDTVAFWVYR